MDKIALIALKKSGAPDISAAIAAKEAAQAAQEAAETAQGKAEDAQEAAETAAASFTVDSAMSDSSTNPVQNKVINAELSDLKSQISQKANIDGSYANMTVGNAEQLVSTIGITDTAPYLFRTSGGSADIGDRKNIKKIVGGNIAWNQLAVKSNYSASAYGLTVSGSAQTGEVAIAGTATSTGVVEFGRSYFNVVIPANHVILLAGSNENVKLRLQNTSSFTQNGVPIIRKFSATNVTTDIVISMTLTADESVNETVRPQIFDLTQMFGSTIADYIYSRETATAGAGVTWFKHYFPRDYYPYCAGSLPGVNISANRMTGFNQWSNSKFDCDEGSNITVQDDAVIVQNKGYQETLNRYKVVPTDTSWRIEFDCETIESSNVNAFFKVSTYYTDGTKRDLTAIEIGNAGNKQHYSENIISQSNKILDHVSFGTWGYAGKVKLTNICINMRWDGERDGEYEEYTQHTYPLDSTITLNGIPKLNANNELEYDGDTYEPDGTVTRRYGVVDLGTLNWTAGSEHHFYCNVASAVKYAAGGNVKMICNGYVFAGIRGASPWYGNNGELTAYYGDHAGISARELYVNDSRYTDVASFKAALIADNVKLVYELNTPTTETADPYAPTMIVDDWGMEEFVVTESTDGVSVPVGHETMYQANLRAKLEMAPNSPADGDGDYIVRQTNGQNAYVPISFPADELPAAPTTDGAYHLKCTVSSGTATYTWESDS